MNYLQNYDGVLFTGGGSRGIQSLAVAKHLYNYYDMRPKIVGGVSAGALVATSMAMSLAEVAYNRFRYLKGKDIYGTFPFEANGKIKLIPAISNLLIKGYVSDFKNLKDILVSTLSEQDFNKLTIPVIVGVTALETQTSEQYNISELDYKVAIDILIASSSIPLLNKPVKYINTMVDGGISQAIPDITGYENINDVLVVSTINNKPDYDKINLEYVVSNTINSIFISNIKDANLRYSTSFKNYHVLNLPVHYSQLDYSNLSITDTQLLLDSIWPLPTYQ